MLHQTPGGPPIITGDEKCAIKERFHILAINIMNQEKEYAAWTPYNPIVGVPHMNNMSYFDLVTTLAPIYQAHF